MAIFGLVMDLLHTQKDERNKCVGVNIYTKGNLLLVLYDGYPADMGVGPKSHFLWFVRTPPHLPDPLANLSII
jgi:hypothetical protein